MKMRTTIRPCRVQKRSMEPPKHCARPSHARSLLGCTIPRKFEPVRHQGAAFSLGDANATLRQKRQSPVASTAASTGVVGASIPASTAPDPIHCGTPVPSLIVMAEAAKVAESQKLSAHPPGESVVEQ